MITQFLDAGLLDVGDDNAKFEYLEKASDDVAKALKKQKRLAVRSILLVMRERLPDNDAVTSLCEEAIKKQWPTYRSRFQNDTNQLFRATLLQAISQTAASDMQYAAITYYCGISLLPYIAIQREQILFRSFLTQLGEKVEAEAALFWTRPTTSPASEIQFEDLPAVAYGVNSKTLTDRLKSAAGPAGGEKANPNWPGSNSVEWLNHFGQYTAEALRDTINPSIKAAIEGMMQQARADITNAFNVAASSAQSQSVLSEIRRTDLLYWKETLYSQGQKQSYRTMPAEIAAVWMAADLHMQMPLLHPHSVEYFLRETLYAAFGDLVSREYKFVDFCTSLGTVPLSLSQNGMDTNSTGVLLLDVMQRIANNQTPIEEVASILGIPGTASIRLDDAAVWIFRDLQTRRLVGGK